MVWLWTNTFSSHVNHITNLHKSSAKCASMFSGCLSRWFVFDIEYDWTVSTLFQRSLELHSSESFVFNLFFTNTLEFCLIRTDFYSMLFAVLGLLWMHPCSYEYNLRVLSAPTDFNPIHICVFNVRDCTADFNHIG